MENTYQVPEQNLDKLRAQMDKLTRRCNRVKIAPPALTVGDFVEQEYTKRNQFGEDVKMVRRVYTVTLVSEGRPKINGYEFAAVLSPVADEQGNLLGNVMRQVPGFEGSIPERFRNADNYCDHCKTTRRRLETFVIANENGFRQIGRNCLGYYLGLTNPETFALMAQILIDASDLCGMSEEDDFGGGSGSYMDRYLMSEVLEVGASAIRQYGWLSGKSAREFEKQSTADRVRDWMFGGPKARENFEHKLTVNDEDRALVAETIEWLGTIDPQTTDDYMYNLSLLARASAVRSKEFGIAVSAISAYSREKERTIRRNARIESDKNSQFIGEIKQRVDFENVTVLYTTTFENDFGVSHFYKMKTGENLVIYFASNDMGWKQGDVVAKFTARIKKHEVREEIKQTVITRVTLPKPELTPAQKGAKKVAAKLRRAAKKILPDVRNVQDQADYQAYCKLNELAWEIEREFLGDWRKS